MNCKRWSAIICAALLGMACSSEREAAVEIPCDEVTWAFEITTPTGGVWVGQTSPLHPGQGMRMKVSGSWRRPGNTGPLVVTGVCDSVIADVVWSVSDPAVASIEPLDSRTALLSARGTGTVDVTASFRVNGAPRSTFLRIVVMP